VEAAERHAPRVFAIPVVAMLLLLLLAQARGFDIMMVVS
jgi:hypothetical protein